MKEKIVMKETNDLSGSKEDNPSAPVGAEADAEEICKAKELLRANGYALIGYRDVGKKVKRAFASGLDFVKSKWKDLGEWISAKRNEMKARQEAAAEKRRLAEEAEARRAETGADSEGSAACTPAVDSADTPKCTACGAELVLGARFCRKCGKPVLAGGDAPSLESPVEAEAESAAVAESTAVVVENAVAVDSAGRNTLKCAVCGAVLTVGMKFCGECGTPVQAETSKARKRKASRPCKSKQDVSEK